MSRGPGLGVVAVGQPHGPGLAGAPAALPRVLLLPAGSVFQLPARELFTQHLRLSLHVGSALLPDPAPTPRQPCQVLWLPKAGKICQFLPQLSLYRG